MPDPILTCENCASIQKSILDSDISGLPTGVEFHCNRNSRVIRDPAECLCLSHDQIPDHNYGDYGYDISEVPIEQAITDWLTHTENVEGCVQAVCRTMATTMDTYMNNCFQAHFEAADRRTKIYVENMIAISVRAMERRSTEEENDDNYEDL